MTELKSIARQAGKKILEIYESEDFGIDQKEDTSPLTKADTAANDIITSGLEKMTPEIPIISEENKLVEYATRKQYKKFWLVDPLDGYRLVHTTQKNHTYKSFVRVHT